MNGLSLIQDDAPLTKLQQVIDSARTVPPKDAPPSRYDLLCLVTAVQSHSFIYQGKPCTNFEVTLSDDSLVDSADQVISLTLWKGKADHWSSRITRGCVLLLQKCRVAPIRKQDRAHGVDESNRRKMGLDIYDGEIHLIAKVNKGIAERLDSITCNPDSHPNLIARVNQLTRLALETPTIYLSRCVIINRSLYMLVPFFVSSFTIILPFYVFFSSLLQSCSLIQPGMPVLSSLNVSTSGLVLGISQRVRVDLQCLAGEIRQAAIKSAASLVIPTNTTTTTTTTTTITTTTTNQQQHEIVLKMTHGEGNVAVSLAFSAHAVNVRQLIVLARALGKSACVHTLSMHCDSVSPYLLYHNISFQYIESPH